MICPKCGGKSRVIDTVHNPVDNEIYRQRKCPNCGRVFYSKECRIDYDQEAMQKWEINHRRYLNRINKKKESIND